MLCHIQKPHNLKNFTHPNSLNVMDLYPDLDFHRRMLETAKNRAYTLCMIIFFEPCCQILPHLIGMGIKTGEQTKRDLLQIIIE